MRLRLLPNIPELGWTPYAWLVYLSFFLLQPILEGASAAEWTATAMAIAVFLYLYFRAYWQGNAGLLACAIGIALLAVLFSTTNPGSNVFFVYAAAFLGHLSPVRRAVIALASLVAALAVLSFALQRPPWYWLPAALFSILIGGINLHFREVSRANAKLRMAQEEVERLAKTAERERIARDLHDLLGHTLSLITLKSELAGKLIGQDPERAGREIREVERISREALREVRTAVAGYRSAGVPEELERARLALESANVKLEYFAAPLDLQPEQETVLALALREAVTNVIRHAAAHTCRIALEQTEREIRLEVRDDGRGGSAPEGIGLASMRERVEALGGRLERRAGTGTSLLISLPRRKPEPGRAGAEESRGGPGVIRVLLAEDQGLVLGALAALLELEADIEVIGRARDGKEALELAEKTSPDVILTDIEMPRMTGLELAAELKRRKSAARVVIVTTFGRSGYLRRALDAGAAGYLLKDSPAERLAEAVRRVHAGLRAVDPELAASVWEEADPLTDRERQVLRLAAEGYAGTRIASELHLSEGTVRNYLSEAISKLGAGNRVEAARIARQKGWL